MAAAAGVIGGLLLSGFVDPEEHSRDRLLDGAWVLTVRGWGTLGLGR